MIEVEKAFKIVIAGEDADLIYRILKSGLTGQIEPPEINHFMSRPMNMNPQTATFTANMYNRDFEHLRKMFDELREQLSD